jgi:glycosyltransferase involved in cell wall biosynthesis
VVGGHVRIGFDARAISYRGIGTYSRNLLRHYADSGVEMVVFCQDQEKDTLPAVDSFTLVSANMDPLAMRSRGAFRSLVEKSKVDLLHVPSSWAPTPLDTPLVATVHDVTPLLYPRSLPLVLRLRYKRQLNHTLGEAKKIITVSQISLSALSAYAGVNPGKVRVIHNGVSERFHPDVTPEEQAAARRHYSLPERFAFWVGDFRPEKNLSFLIHAWSRLSHHLADPPTLVLAGAQRGEYRKLRKEVEKRGLEGKVLFPGFIRDDDLPAVYSAATIFVFPSLYEGFGLPPLEAMACGTPCVVSNSSSLPEVTGPAALLFNPTSLDSLQECVLRVLADHELYEALRQDGLRQSALFPWSKAAKETLGVYRAVLEEMTPPQAFGE